MQICENTGVWVGEYESGCVCAAGVMKGWNENLHIPSLSWHWTGIITHTAIPVKDSPMHCCISSAR